MMEDVNYKIPNENNPFAEAELGVNILGNKSLLERSRPDWAINYSQGPNG